MYAYIRVYVRVHIHVRIYVHVYVHVHVQIHVCVNVCIHARVIVYIHLSICINIYLAIFWRIRGFARGGVGSARKNKPVGYRHFSCVVVTALQWSIVCVYECECV